MIEVDEISLIDKYLSEIEGVIFDLDDTLFLERDYVKSGFNAVACHFCQYSSMFDDLWSSFLQGKKAIDDVFLRYGISDKKKQAIEIYRNHQPDIKLLPGVNDLLWKLKKTKKIGIITDGRPEGQRAKIIALGLSNIPYIITDELGGVEFRKPNTKSFYLMSKILDIPYNRLIYIGDNIMKDPIAPEILGMKCIIVKNRQGIYYKHFN